MGSVDKGERLRRARKARATKVACATLAAVALAPLPAAAAQQDNALLRSEIVDTAIIRNAGAMDFGNIFPTTAGGTVVISASATPPCSVTGGLGRSGPCKSPIFNGTAFFQADVRVQRPAGNAITLTGPGGATMVVDTFTFSSTGLTAYLGTTGANSRFRVDATDGTYTFYVGGTLHVAANQVPGIYNGSFQVRITYN